MTAPKPAPNPAGSIILYELFHFPKDNTGTFNLLERKDLGVYESLAEAEAGVARRIGFQGFRDTPDGFVVFPTALDHDRWPQGVANVNTGDRFPDHGLRCRPGAWRPAAPLLNKPTWHVVFHFPIAAGSEDAFADEEAWKLIGIYSTAALAKAAQERASRLPGFRDWPGGFRHYGTSKNNGSWPDGFFDWTKEVWDDEA